MEGVFAEQSTFLESTRDVEHEYARLERNGSDSEIRSDIEFHEQHKNGIDVTTANGESNGAMKSKNESDA